MSQPLYVGPLLHLRTLRALEELSASQLYDLAYECEEVVLERDAELVRVGEAPQAMYLIVDGFATAGPRGEVVGPGGVVGFFEVLSAGAARFPAVAKTEIVALRIESDALRDVCEQSFPLLSALIAYVAGRIARDGETLTRVMEGRSVPAPALAETELGRVGRILVLQRAPALTGRHVDALAELAGTALSIVVAAGEALSGGTGPGNRLFVVSSGGLDVTNGSGVRVAVGAGATMGLVEVLSGRDQAWQAIASEDSVLLQIEAETFIDVLEDHFEMAFDLLSWLTRQLVSTSDRNIASTPAPD